MSNNAAPDPQERLLAEKSCCRVCDAKKTCHLCGTQTLYACSDCRIDFGVSIYVCPTESCRAAHEQKCSARVRADLAAVRAQLEDEKARTRAATIEADLAFESEQKYKRQVVEFDSDLTALRAQLDAKTEPRLAVVEVEDGKIHGIRIAEAGNLEYQRRLRAEANLDVSQAEVRRLTEELAHLNTTARELLDEAKRQNAELRARLALPPPQKEEDDQARVAPSVPCVETTGSIAEQPTGAVTAAERTEKS